MKRNKPKRKYSKDDIILNIGMTILCLPLILAGFCIPIFGLAFIYGGVFYIYDAWTSNCE